MSQPLMKKYHVCHVNCAGIKPFMSEYQGNNDLDAQ